MKQPWEWDENNLLALSAENAASAACPAKGIEYPFSPPLDSRLTFMVSIETWNPRR
jgi:hypothetical protein